MGVGCSANGAPPGYWTGTPTGGFPFRCQLNGQPVLSGGTSDRLSIPFNNAAFSLPAVDSYGIGNSPPTLLYGSGLENFDVGLQKDFTVGSEKRPKVLSFKFEAFNVLNHFNPSNPTTANLTLNLNCGAVNGFCTAGGANTNAAFGTVTSAQIQARHAALTIRFRF